MTKKIPTQDSDTNKSLAGQRKNFPPIKKTDMSQLLHLVTRSDFFRNDND